MDAQTSRLGLVRLADGALRTLAPDELGEIDRLRTEPGTLVWLDIGDPDDAAIDLLRDEFSVHPLAIEDLERRNQRPKVDTYPGQHAIVAYEVLRNASASTDRDERWLGEIHLLAGAGYLVSIHWGATPAIESVRRRFEQRTDAVGGNVGWLLYAILDTVVDGYFPLLDGMSDEIDDLEDRIVAGGQAGETLRQVLDIKRRLLELRRVLAPQRDVANALLRRDVALIDDAAIPYYQDLYDHLVRVLDQLDLYRDLVAAALDANLSVTSNTLNAVMKRLTALTVVLMVPTLIAGVYGMNFKVMPELTWPFGYFAALALMGLLMAALALFFWRRDWF
jgi:magnesium transporter